MNTCRFCGIDKGKRKLYCSVQCIKKAFYLKRHPHCHYGDQKGFWESETGVGFKWEKYVADLIGGKHLEFNGKHTETQRADILWNGYFVDVKSARLNKRKNKRGKPVLSEQKGYWVFKGGRPKKIDYIFCVCVGENEKVEKILKIPFKEYNYKVGITVGWNSIKYDKYLYVIN